jgi:TBC1 domain family protein 5
MVTVSQIFLQFRSTDKSAWSTGLGDTRTAYSSLKDHFLKYIERPNEVGSALDPLDDDKNASS